jgi:hypothetical protein
MLAAAGFLAGCGRTNPTPTINEQAVLERYDTLQQSLKEAGAVVPEAPVTKTKALAYAKVVNLKAVDVPLGEVWGEGERFAPERAEVLAVRCAGVDTQGAVAALESPTYELPSSSSLYSRVQIWSTAALATQNVEAELSARGLGCIRREGQHSAGYTLTENGHTVDRVRTVLDSVGRLPSPLTNVPGSFSLRETFTNYVSPRAPADVLGAHLPGHPAEALTYDEDTFGFIVGPAEVVLVSHHATKQTSTTAARRALMAIYHRAGTHKL